MKNFLLVLTIAISLIGQLLVPAFAVPTNHSGMYKNSQTANVDNISVHSTVTTMTDDCDNIPPHSTVTMTDGCDDMSANCCQGGLGGCTNHCNAAAHFVFIPMAINHASHISAEPKIDNLTCALNSVVLTKDNSPPIF